MAKDQGSDVPRGYCFHPGHTWVLDEGRQNARIGLDTFGDHLPARLRELHQELIDRLG